VLLVPLNIAGGMGLFEDGNDVLLEKSMRELADVHVLSLEHKLPVITKNENSPHVKINFLFA
jgi:hypothetical protein